MKKKAKLKFQMLYFYIIALNGNAPIFLRPFSIENILHIHLYDISVRYLSSIESYQYFTFATIFDG